LPRFVEHFAVWPVEPDKIVSALHDWKAVASLLIRVAVESHGDRVVGVAGGGEAVDVVDAEFVRLE
jgi:hypothetical protein